jgi:hypothetical protein
MSAPPPSPDNRPAATRDDVRQLLEAIRTMQGGGATIQVKDSRLSAVRSWLVGAGLVIFLGICSWGVLKITTLSELMERVVTQNGWLIEQQRDHEARLRELERKR